MNKMSIKEEIIAINKQADKIQEIRQELKNELLKFDEMMSNLEKGND